MADSAQTLAQLTPEQRKQLEEKLKNMSPEQLKELQKQQCIFCQIISGKIPSKKLYEDDSVMAILDINPAARGHVLLLPKEHYSLLPQMPEKEVGRLYSAAKKLSQVLLKALRADGTTIFLANGAVAGQRAQHVMLHIIPRKEGDGGFALQEKVLDKEAWEQAKEAIKMKLSKSEKIERKEKAENKKEKEKVSEKEETEEESKEPEETKNSRKKEEVSLDDIADLFK